MISCLDIEVTSNELDYIARCLDKLNLPLSTLDKILRYDLFSILIQRIENQRLNPPGILTGCVRSAAWLALGGMVTLPCDQVKAQMQHRL